MIDGKYNCSLNTPMGAINGTITLVSNEVSVQGILETMGMKNKFNGKKTKENECAFTGDFNTPMGNIKYEATCRVINNTQLELVANTSKGSFKIQGKRM